jgi:hypothetical protein
MLYLQKVAGELWEWSIRPEELGQFLEETGWTIAHEEGGGARKQGEEFYAVVIK